MSTPVNRILMIEDDPGIRRFVRLVLEDEGWQVFEADSARRGLIEAASRQPDLVILDLGLPDADGKQVLTELRGWSSVPVLVLSAREREDEKVAALDAGADDYLVKPFGVPELLARLRVMLRRRQQLGAAGGAGPLRPARCTSARCRWTWPRTRCGARGSRCTSRPSNSACWQP